MTEGCTGCWMLKGTTDKDREIAIKNATQYVQEKNISVALYQENGEWKFTDAQIAVTGNYPIWKIISHHY